MFCFLAMGVSGFLRASPFGRDTMGQPLIMGDSPCFGDKPYLCEDVEPCAHLWGESPHWCSLRGYAPFSAQKLALTQKILHSLQALGPSLKRRSPSQKAFAFAEACPRASQKGCCREEPSKRQRIFYESALPAAA